MTLDESMDDEVKVTIIATGFQEQSKEAILKQPQRDILGRPTIATVRRESESFITRGINSERTQKEEEKIENPADDLETPAFIRRSLNKKTN